MAGSRRKGGPKAGAILTGTIVGQAKKGVLIELGSVELLLPRSRYGTSGDRIEEAGYGEPLTVEVVATGEGGVSLTRVAIDRSLRQPRSIEGVLARAGGGFELRPADGAPPIAVFVLDRPDPDALVGAPRTWAVGAPHRELRFIEPDEGHVA